jgi:hypothetical protein
VSSDSSSALLVSSMVCALVGNVEGTTSSLTFFAGAPAKSMDSLKPVDRFRVAVVSLTFEIGMDIFLGQHHILGMLLPNKMCHSGQCQGGLKPPHSLCNTHQVNICYDQMIRLFQNLSHDYFI